MPQDPPVIAISERHDFARQPIPERHRTAKTWSPGSQYVSKPATDRTTKPRNASGRRVNVAGSAATFAAFVHRRHPATLLWYSWGMSNFLAALQEFLERYALYQPLGALDARTMARTLGRRLGLPENQRDILADVAVLVGTINEALGIVVIHPINLNENGGEVRISFTYEKTSVRCSLVVEVKPL
jgi:hypothetical protein